MPISSAILREARAEVRAGRPEQTGSSLPAMPVASRDNSTRMSLDLDAAERAALLSATIAADRYPLLQSYLQRP